MSLNDYEADVLARLEEQIEDDDPDLAMQFLALEHPALRGYGTRARSSRPEKRAARRHLPVAALLLIAACLPGVLFGAWTLVSAICLIGAMVVGLAALGTVMAERGDTTSSHPSSQPGPRTASS